MPTEQDNWTGVNLDCLRRPTQVYGASCLMHAALWNDWAKENGLLLTSRWTRLEKHFSRELLREWGSSNPSVMRVFWEMDFQDISTCDILVCYHQTGDVLRGALVECGMAIGMGKPVILVGDSFQFGTWQYHPKVSKVPSLEEAAALIRLKKVEC